MNLHEQFLQILDLAIEQAGSASKLAEKLGVHTNLITRWKNQERTPTLTTMQPLMDLMGVQFFMPQAEASKEVHFVNAKIIGADNIEELPSNADDYLAAPIVGEVGAGPGILPQNEIKGWFIVERKLAVGRGLHNLIAVEIAPRSISMKPTLNPGDIVLVDRDDRDLSRTGNIMLVLDPVDGSGMIKRVSAAEKKDDVQLTFYSDNSSTYPPMVYSLADDFDGDWDKAIIGRVIWAWQDVRDK